MATSQETLHPVPFRVEVQHPEDIYTLLMRRRITIARGLELMEDARRGVDVSREFEVVKNSPSNDIEIANVSFAGDLFSCFIAYAAPLKLGTAFALTLYGYYQNPEEHGRFSIEEAEQIHNLLTGVYGKSTRHFEISPFNSFKVEDEYEQMRTDIGLNYDPDSQEKSWLWMHLVDITNPLLPLEIGSRVPVSLRDQTDFVRKIGKWALCIEDIVRAIAQIKDIPQTGVLTLHPPERT